MALLLVLGGHLPVCPESSLGPGSGQTRPQPWVGSQAVGIGVKTTPVAHLLRTLGTTRGPVLCAAPPLQVQKIQAEFLQLSSSLGALTDSDAYGVWG